MACFTLVMKFNSACKHPCNKGIQMKKLYCFFLK